MGSRVRTKLQEQFNTAADGGIGPLSMSEIRSRLTADLFFTDQMCIPGTSLLCNPATFKMLHEDVAFLVRLLSENKIVAILMHDTPSFSDLTERLVESGSAAFSTSGQPVSTVREAAKLLDQNLHNRQIVTVRRDKLEQARADTKYEARS
jgi:hypothetical protein